MSGGFFDYEDNRMFDWADLIFKDRDIFYVLPIH